MALAAVGLVGAVVHGTTAVAPWIVAPMGASAVLVFAVPTSPMAQPWPTVGGNGLSALVGLGTGALIGHGTIAIGVAVMLALVVMSVTRCLHPPGGAAALTAALGGPGVGWLFPLAPVALNAVVLVAAGWAFHRVAGHGYPHHRVPPAAARPPLLAVGEDVSAVLAELGETYDVSTEDLREIVRRVAASRSGA